MPSASSVSRYARSARLLHWLMALLVLLAYVLILNRGQFERGSLDTRLSGAGLGLSLVKSLIELHGGRVALDSRVGGGTRVTCHVPLGPLPAEQDHTDEAMELLKEMDGYLTEAEAEPFREVARGVIGKARENLGLQFKVAVQDRQWATAAAVGRRIVREFPNTRMAQEVRGMLDGILSRANNSAGAAH